MGMFPSKLLKIVGFEKMVRLKSCNYLNRTVRNLGLVDVEFMDFQNVRRNYHEWAQVTSTWCTIERMEHFAIKKKHESDGNGCKSKVIETD